MSPSRLPFETLDRFLGLLDDSTVPRVLVDLSWLPDEGVVLDSLYDEMEALALRAFRLCTAPNEWIYAWDSVDEYSDRLYRFWPHRAQAPRQWEVTFYPYGANQVFVSQTFDWGIYAHWSYPGLEPWALSIFGQPLLDAFTDHWPGAWSTIVSTS
jgi:hypothetical protein